MSVVLDNGIEPSEWVEVRQLGHPVLDIWVDGVAQPKGSKTPRVVGKRANGSHIIRQIESADMGGNRKRNPGTTKKAGALTDWSAAMADAAAKAWTEAPLDEPVHVVAEFRIKRPSSYRAGLSYLSTKPDADKLLRAALDSLQKGGVLREDSRVVAPWPIKRLCEKGEEPGVRLRVWQLGLWESAGWILHVPDHPVLVRKGDPS